MTRLAGTGYCAITHESESLCSEHRSKGVFAGIYLRVVDCIRVCMTCTVCYVISYSKQMNDCSWYQRCDLDQLNNDSSTHRSYRVRFENGSVSAPAQRLLGIHRRDTQQQDDAWRFEHGRNGAPILFHESSARLEYLHSRRPLFHSQRRWLGRELSVSELRTWQESIRQGPWANFSAARPTWASCAVVGSSASLLETAYGRQIDEHAAVYRINRAPVESAFARHVGSRTSVRVWGDQSLPDQSLSWGSKHETIVLYCGPNLWVGYCWTWIGTSPRPRFSALLYEEVLLAMNGWWAPEPTKYPTSGAMAIWLALAQCHSVSAFGFGWCDGMQPQGKRGNATRVYYDVHDRRSKAGFAIHHAMEVEWQWVRELDRRGVLSRFC